MTERARSSQRRNRNRVAGADRPAAGASQTVAATSPPHMSLRPVAKAVLFLAFAFTIMADPVSSVAYTIEASLRALHGHLGLLMATQLIVLAIILLIDVNYWQLVARFPLGGGSAEAAARAFGTGWVFVPIGALIVDFILTITISVAAAVSALISYVPSLAPMRVSWPVLRPSPHIPVIGSIYLVCKLGAQAAAWHRVPAVVVKVGPIAGWSRSGSPASLSVRWLGQGRSWRTGEVEDTAAAVAGDTVIVWVDAKGQLTRPPLTRAEVIAQVVRAVLAVTAGIGLLLAVVGWVVSFLLDRHRLAGWEADWSVTEPRWTRSAPPD